MTFVAGRTYLLADQDSYDDDYGTGYGFVRAVEGADGCLVADCWIVDGHGNVHPGYDCSPVPVRFTDVHGDPLKILRSAKLHS